MCGASLRGDQGKPFLLKKSIWAAQPVSTMWALRTGANTAVFSRMLMGCRLRVVRFDRPVRAPI